MKRKIKVKFLDWWTPNVQQHVIYKALSECYDVELCEDADYVIYSIFGNDHLFVPDHCIKIFYTGENVTPDFNFCDYALGFDWMDFGDRYMRLPNYYNTTFRQATDDMCQKHIVAQNPEILSAKNGFCSFVVSNGDNANPIRNQFFELLSAKYKQVSSGGRYKNNIGGPVDDKRTFERKHKFSIAFENSSRRGYSTEKIVDAFAACTVPIYWGDPEINRIFNKNAFINVLDFDSLDAVIERVKEIDENEALYLDMLRQPALAETQRETMSWNEQYVLLSKFLSNIIEQPLSEAKRYNREFWGKRLIEQEQSLVVRARKGWKELLKENVRNKVMR